MAEKAKLEVFIDGSCAFCQAVRERVEKRDIRHRLEFQDYNDPAVATRVPFPRERLDAEMHVHKLDGTWAVGFEGWRAILLELPQYKWLGWLFGVFPFHSMGPGIYRWIARHRYRIPGFPPPCTNESCAMPQRPAPKTAVSDSSAVARPHTR
ncbi:MAG TPA: DUF393 domain-containing protein [Candidatus Acidoferrales bacterium]|nr:DUF393 domain-containing protein [Candidatus Acidoferrales bacterium]